MAGDYPGGVVQVWNAQTGRQLTKIKTSGYSYDIVESYSHPTPDWDAIYVSRRGKRMHTRIEKEGKKLIRWEFEGDVCAWDLKTGELRENYQHAPPRGIRLVELSPDGSTFVTSEELPGEWSGVPKQTTSLWNARTKQYRSLDQRLNPYGTFSPDSRTVAFTTHSDFARNNYTTGIKLFDVETGREKLSISIPGECSSLARVLFSPKADIVVGHLSVRTKRDSHENWQSYLTFWETTSGKRIASFPADEKSSDFALPLFSPDGQTLATTNFYRAKNKLYLFNVTDRKLRSTTLLGEGDTTYVKPPVFSPDGNWIAVITQVFPKYLQVRDPAVEDAPQPRIHLIDVATGELRETLIAPQGFTASASFSPDGKTLATGGHGKVLLWDFTTPPGTEVRHVR